jgi:hypothetical protein
VVVSSNEATIDFTEAEAVPITTARRNIIWEKKNNLLKPTFS